MNQTSPNLRRYTVRIGRRDAQPRLKFEAMAASAMDACVRHLGLCEPLERVEVMPTEEELRERDRRWWAAQERWHRALGHCEEEVA
jgi:hypothetical protein